MTATVLTTLDLPLPANPPDVLAEPEWKVVFRQLKEDLQLFGLDILQPFSIGWYARVCTYIPL